MFGLGQVSRRCGLVAIGVAGDCLLSSPTPPPAPPPAKNSRFSHPYFPPPTDYLFLFSREKNRAFLGKVDILVSRVFNLIKSHLIN
jgi:hypothetical protein